MPKKVASTKSTEKPQTGDEKAKTVNDISEDIRKKLDLLSLYKAVSASEPEPKKEFKFWTTQPVPKLGTLIITLISIFKVINK